MVSRELWRHIVYQGLRSTLLIVAILLFGSIATASKAAPACAPDFSRAVQTFVEGHFGPRMEAAIAAMNEPLCEEKEDMANLVVLAGSGSAIPLYAIVHMHVAKDGSFGSAANFNSNAPWKLSVPDNAWRDEWCAMLRTIYPRDFIDQCADL